MPERHLRIRTAGVSWREVGGELIALDVESSSYFSTNASGALMWKSLVDGSTERELAELLSMSYGITPEQAATDARSFVGLLDEHDLLEE